MNNKEKQDSYGKQINEYDIEKVLNKFDSSHYNEDFVITNNILKYHMKSIELYNYEKNKICDKKELDLYKDKLINRNNVHYYPYELYFNTYKNVYKEDKVLLSLPNNIKKANDKEHDEKDDQEEKDEKEEKEDNASNIFEEEHGLEDDYNYEYNKSEDELDNEGNDENVI